MCRGHVHFRRGASSRRCNVVDDLVKRAPGEAAVAAVEVLMSRALGEAAVAVEAVVDDPLKRAPGEAAVTAVEVLMNHAPVEAAAAAELEVEPLMDRETDVMKVASGECVRLLVDVFSLVFGVSSVLLRVTLDSGS